MSMWIPTWRLKDKTPLFGPFTKKPTDPSIEIIINGKSYWVKSTVKEFTSEQQAEVIIWIKKKMRISD
jgi:hypothetical protein